MNSEWLDLWLEDWEWRWLFVWADLRGMVSAMIDFDAAGTAYHWRALTPDIRVVALHIVALVEHGVTSVTFIWEEWANQFVADFEAWLLALLGIEVEPDAPAIEHIANLWESIIALWARFGYAITNTDLTVVDWVQDKLSLVWGSIVAIWARFGPAFLDGDWTVVSWVEDKVTAVVQWVLSMYETARLQAEAAALWIATCGQVLVDWLTDYGDVLALWIATHGQVIADWIADYGQNLVDWYTKYATFYADLYDNYHDLLLEFLQDPGAFITKYVDQIIVVPPDEPDLWWLAWLLRLILDPIGTVLGWIGRWHGLIADWILAWLDENFPSLDEMIDSIELPDLGLPDVMVWAQGLREPETDEEKAYVAYLDVKLQHVLDDLLPDNPPIYLG